MTPIDISGVTIPASALTRDARQFVRDTAGALLFSHSSRVYFWAALTGNRRGMRFDPELLYAAAMFHDIGLTVRYNESQLRFEVDGANAAREFLRSHHVSDEDIGKVWVAIALHTTPGIPEFMNPEAGLIQVGAAMDVVGRGFEQFTPAQREAVVAAFPREEGFKRGLIDTFYAGLKHRPDSTYGTFNDDILACKDPDFRRGDYCRMIMDSPWPD